MVDVNSAIVVAFAVAVLVALLLATTSTDRYEWGAISTKLVRVM